MIYCPTEILVFDNNTRIGNRYFPEVIQRGVLFHGVLSLNFLIMYDNTTPHWSEADYTHMNTKDFHQIAWSARTSELNTIQHIRDILGRRIKDQNLASISIYAAMRKPSG